MTGIDRSQRPSERHPYGVAVCGTPIEPGMFVFTNEMRVGKVVEGSIRPHNPEWFDVEYRDGSTVMQNPERVATKFHDGIGMLEAEERGRHHDFRHSLMSGTAICRYCETVGIGDDEDLCSGVKTYLDVGDDFRHEMPYSEVCMHLNVDGKEMAGSLVEGGMVQLWNDDGSQFSFPITAGEAGLYWDSTRGAYYYYREGWES